MIGIKHLFGFNIFKKTQEIEEKITSFLLNIIEAGLLYEQAMSIYFTSGITPEFDSLKDKVSALESVNDNLRRKVENNLYKHMILPDMRSDILHLLEGCDRIINRYESNLLILSVERVELVLDIKENMAQMITLDLECVGALISGVKSFFKGQNVDEFIEKTYQLEREVDVLALSTKALVFDNKHVKLANQLQLKSFIYSIEKISDIAEIVADLLKIMAVKHTL